MLIGQQRHGRYEAVFFATLGDLCLWLEPQAGIFLWAELPEGLDSAAIARKALERDMVMAPGNVFSVSRNAARFLRFNVAQSADKRIFDVLAEVMEKTATSCEGVGLVVSARACAPSGPRRHRRALPGP